MLIIAQVAKTSSASLRTYSPLLRVWAMWRELVETRSDSTFKNDGSYAHLLRSFDVLDSIQLKPVRFNMQRETDHSKIHARQLTVSFPIARA